jgi:hypothetical protein
MIPGLAVFKLAASAIPLRIYVYAAIAFTILGLAWYGDHERARANKAETALVNFKASVKAAGEQAKRDAARQAAADLRNKERADEDYKAKFAVLTARAERVRVSDAARIYVPAPSPTTRSPDLACFDRAELDGAIKQLVGRVRGLAGKSDERALELETAREWARGRSPELAAPR